MKNQKGQLGSFVYGGREIYHDNLSALHRNLFFTYQTAMETQPV